MASTREQCILPLPSDVAAQIKSSSAIVSLAGVVLELLKNALDAGATKIEATVDFGRGGCSVEDNGRGIAPLEFRHDGGLGKLFCTSRDYSGEVCFARNGTFLASLAAVSLLTVTSHHHEHRSHNSITFHHSKVIRRQLPAPPRFELDHEKHGTRVSVRNLFGNIPVRVKQRAVVVELRAEHDRLWDNLKREIACLILSWRGLVSLRVRDADNKLALNIHALSNTASKGPSGTLFANKSRPNELQFILNVLTQTSYISIDDWPAWIAVSASTSNISIKGAISLDPAPTKRVQFISLEAQPLSSDARHNELYDEINRIFVHSNFGTIENDADIDEVEKVRRQRDKRFKSDGYTNRQLKGRKGVDRFPMFHLRISLRDEHRFNGFEDRFFDNGTNLQAATEVLNAMITQWLSVHHFQPRKRNGRQDRPSPASTSASPSKIDGQEAASTSRVLSQASQRTTERETSRLTSSNPDLPTPKPGKRKRSTISQPRTVSKRMQRQPFAEWSRIKSGKPAFYDKIWASGQQATPTHVSQEYSGEQIPPLEGFATFNTKSELSGTLTIPCRTDPQSLSKSDENKGDFNDVCRDDTIRWNDLGTKQTYVLNARTGFVIPEVFTRPQTDPSSSGLGNTLTQSNKPLRTRPRSTDTDEGETPWIQELLRTWDNPIFKPAEKRIQQMSLEEQEMDNGAYNHSSHSGCSKFDMEKAFSESSLTTGSKLSKVGLQTAQVIAQLDKKFILVKVTDLHSNHGNESEVLVFIDQHAADERIRVEALFSELCAPLPKEHSHSHYRSKLGHGSSVTFTVLEKPLQFSVSSQEQKQFATHAARFGAWGILFDITTSVTATASAKVPEKTLSTLSVATLPPSIAERCKADPQLLISFLRSTVWKYVEDPHPLSLVEDLLPPLAAENESAWWLRRLATCPQGIVELINSRACRSAIMFNDELSMQQCEDLVAKLSRCVFPFMCAHGRPSMVPLVDLGHAKGYKGLGLGFASSVPDRAEIGFVHAWKQWKRQ